MLLCYQIKWTGFEKGIHLARVVFNIKWGSFLIQYELDKKGIWTGRNKCQFIQLSPLLYTVEWAWFVSIRSIQNLWWKEIQLSQCKYSFFIAIQLNICHLFELQIWWDRFIKKISFAIGSKWLNWISRARIHCTQYIYTSALLFLWSLGRNVEMNLIAHI